MYSKKKKKLLSRCDFDTKHANCKYWRYRIYMINKKGIIDTLYLTLVASYLNKTSDPIFLKIAVF